MPSIRKKDATATGVQTSSLFIRRQFAPGPVGQDMAMSPATILCTATAMVAASAWRQRQSVAAHGDRQYDRTLSISSIQCFTGVSVPDCRCVTQPMLPLTMSWASVAARCLSLLSRNW
ncbi:hypothetical protein PMI40_01119 [Herbaspirillum sp. YR522]|nr:hypothetical protein PMI40_01119 [Herbaspirillum sp. YR522]